MSKLLTWGRVGGSVGGGKESVLSSFPSPWGRTVFVPWILIAQINWCYLVEGNSIGRAVSSRLLLRKFLCCIYWKSKRSLQIAKVQEFHSTHFHSDSQDFTPEFKLTNSQLPTESTVFHLLGGQRIVIVGCKVIFCGIIFLLTPTGAQQWLHALLVVCEICTL